MHTGRVVAMAAWAALLGAALGASSPASIDPQMRMIAAGQSAGAVRMAREGAARRLADPRCAQVFSEFTDAEGRPLQERLDRYRMSGPEYLSLVFFADGLDRGRCEDDGILATATPGSRLVSVCGRFARAYRSNPTWGEVVVIHEALHTLGLGENPPSSSEISARVVALCR
jgi:hypothetical protein